MVVFVVRSAKAQRVALDDLGIANRAALKGSIRVARWALVPRDEGGVRVPDFGAHEATGLDEREFGGDGFADVEAGAGDGDGAYVGLEVDEPEGVARAALLPVGVQSVVLVLDWLGRVGRCG